MRFYGEPLVVSCERTVSVGGGLVKDAGMVFNQRTGCRTSLFVCKPAPADLGPGTGHHQGRALGQRAAQSDRKPGMLMANIQSRGKSFSLRAFNGTTRSMTLWGPISLHGGHSGEFCCHARDNLADIIRQYIHMGFRQVGITEHIPPVHPKFLYPEEIEQGLTVDHMYQRFARYFTTIRQLQADLADRIQIFAGMEIEAFTGYLPHVRHLSAKFLPDYLVGSVHHVADICFDYSAHTYGAAVTSCGSVKALYMAYFDRQFEMIQAVRPFVVGHFDLVRIHDPDYTTRLLHPDIARKIDRNLDLIKDLGLVMDLNLRPLARGEAEPYPARSILEKIRSRQIPMVPGDDSHGVAQAGKHVDTGIRLLEKMGFDTKWPDPALLEMK